MLKVLELMMIKSNLLKMMVTVFKHNEGAVKLFKEVLKYEIDPRSPKDSPYEQFDIEILSRWKNRLIFKSDSQNHFFFPGSMRKRNKIEKKLLKEKLQMKSADKPVQTNLFQPWEEVEDEVNSPGDVIDDKPD